MKKIFILFAAVLCSLTLSAKKPVYTQWTPEQAREWWSHTEWPVGCCYVPTYAINQFEMWQEDTFNPEILEAHPHGLRLFPKTDCKRIKTGTFRAPEPRL